MDLESYREKCKSEPRYAGLVSFLTGVIRSGSFSGDELVAAGYLAAETAEAERVKIPGREHTYAEVGRATDTTQP